MPGRRAVPQRAARKGRESQGMLIDLSTQALWKRFPIPFAGVDEAGRGCLAGPVVAAAVILPEEDSWDLPGLGDSKKLSAARRSRLEPEIKNQAMAWSIGISWPEEIDRINILRASLLAMRRAVELLKTAPVFLAVDGNQPVDMPLEQKSIPGGDGSVPAIAAASILAKTFRDRLLSSLDKRYPGYGFAGHKGYGTKEHLDALRAMGPCRMHRKTFRGVLSSPAQQDFLCLPDI